MPEELVIASLRALYEPASAHPGDGFTHQALIKRHCAAVRSYWRELAVFGSVAREPRRIARAIANELLFVDGPAHWHRVAKAERPGGAEALRMIVVRSHSDDVPWDGAVALVARVDAMLARCARLITLALDWVPAGPIAARRVCVWHGGERDHLSDLMVRNAADISVELWRGAAGKLVTGAALRSLALSTTSTDVGTHAEFGAILRQSPLVVKLLTSIWYARMLAGYVDAVASSGGSIVVWDVYVCAVTDDTPPSLKIAGLHMPPHLRHLSLSTATATDYRRYGGAAFLDGLNSRPQQPTALRSVALHVSGRLLKGARIDLEAVAERARGLGAEVDIVRT